MNTNLPVVFRMLRHRIIPLSVAFLLVFITSFRAVAQTTLSQGDLSIVAIGSGTGGRGISFVTWVNLSAGTEIKFTDNGFNSILGSNANNNVRWTEQVVTWTATSAIAAGTVVSITDANDYIGSKGSAIIRESNGTTASNWDLNNAYGDQVFAFQGTGAATAGNNADFKGTVLYGLGFQGYKGLSAGWLALGVASNSNCYLPLELLLGDNLFFGLEATGAQYTGPRTGFATLAAYKLAVANVLNWTITTDASGVISHNASPFTPSLPPPVVTADPVSKAVCAGGGTSFSVTATGATGYQWEVDGGLGFLPVIDLPPYSGGSTANLTINYTTALMNNQRYRCLVYGATSVYSGVATLKTSVILTTGTQTNISCNGGSNGTATVNVGGGVEPYTYAWSPAGGTGATATGLSAGVYSVQVTDAIGCTGKENYILLQPTAMNATTITTSVACNGDNSGSAGIIPVGGVLPYKYSWSPSGGTGSVATGLYAGSYTVTVTDGAGCTMSRNFTITQPTALTATTAQTNISCNGASNGSASINVSGGAGSYGYVWTPFGGLGKTATGLPAGEYQVTAADANGCIIKKTINITQPAAMSVTRSQTNVSCFGGSNGTAGVIVSGGTGTKTYSWWPSGGTGATATGLTAGVYTLTITDANECTKTEVFAITQPSAMIASVSHTDVSCTGFFDGTAAVGVIGGTAPYTYNWSPSGGTKAVATELETGTYQVTVTDVNGCSVMRTVTIGQLTTITANVSQNNVTCYGGNNGSATVTPAGGIEPYTYSWAPYGGTSATATGLEAGTYTVTIKGALGCSINKTIIITQPTELTGSANITSESMCSGNSTDISLTSPVNGATFSWTVHTVSGNVSGASSGSGSSIEQTLTGKGTVEYTVVPASGSCTGKAFSVSIEVKPSVAINIHPFDQVVEENQSVDLAIIPANWTELQWEVDRGEGFEAVQDDENFINSGTWNMTILHFTPSLNGYRFRCIAKGECGKPVISKIAKLTIGVKADQTISFPELEAVEYGTPDFNAGASTSADLDIIYTSSDESIATVVNGQIHIIRAGNVTITATQPGNGQYKAAAPVQRQITITPKALTLAVNEEPAVTKPYDGNTNAVLASGNFEITGLVGEDAVTVSATGTYDNPAAGDNKKVTVNNFVLSGPAKDNYTISTASVTVKGSITKKTLTVSATRSLYVTKIYDGTTTAVLRPTALELNGAGSASDLTVVAKADFDNKNAGYDKTITIHSFELAGPDKDNYEISTEELTIYGDITPREILAAVGENANITKEYDGGVQAELGKDDLEGQTIVSGDDLHITAVAAFDTKNAGTDKKVTLTELNLAGEDKANYTLLTVKLVTKGTITRKVLSTIVNDLSVITKVYDGNTEASIPAGAYLIDGVIGEDQVTLNNPTNGSYDTKHGGENKSVIVSGIALTGEDAANYELKLENIQPLTGTITPKKVVVKAIDATKVYGQADPELTYEVETLVEGDKLEGALSRTEGKDAGTYEIVLGSLNGGTDYEIVSFTGASISIGRATLEIRAEAKWREEGEANPEFTFTYHGLVGSDPSAELETMPLAMTTAHAQSPIGEYEIRTWGATSKNYTITHTPAMLTVMPANDAPFKVQVWSSSPGVLQFRIWSEKAQNSTIALYTRHGQEVILNRKGLDAGMNSFSIPVEKLAAGPYIVAVNAGKFKVGQKIMIR